MRTPTALDDPSRRIPRLRAACAVALAALLLRLAWLLAPGPDVAPRWVYPEEQHRGNVAVELLRGPLLDVQDYHHAPNVGGSLVVGVLATPFVALLGDRIFAVRLPTVLFHAAAVALLFLILDRWRSRRAAWIGAALFAVAPPGYAAMTMTALGTHVENNTLVLGVLYAFLSLQERLERGERARAHAFALGLLAGFAGYFGYGVALVLVTLLALAWTRDRLVVVRPWFALAALGFAIGLAPWLRYNLRHDFAALTIYDRPLTGSGGWSSVVEALDKLRWLLAEYLPASMYFRGEHGLRWPWAERALAWTLLAALAFAAWHARHGLLALARRLVRRDAAPPRLELELVCAVFALVFAVSFALTSIVTTRITLEIAHDGRYTAPLVPFLCLALALSADAAWERARPWPAITRTVVLASIALCLAGVASMFDRGDPTSGWRTPGSSPEELARWFAWRYKTDEARVARWIDGLDRRDEDVREGTLFVLAETLKSRLMIIPPTDAARAAARERFRRSLAFLRERVEPRYRWFCEEPRPGERPRGWRERELLRRELAELDAR